MQLILECVSVVADLPCFFLYSQTSPLTTRLVIFRQLICFLSVLAPKGLPVTAQGNALGQGKRNMRQAL
jgi:hypothetical protein